MATLASIELVHNVPMFSTLTERHLETIVERCRVTSARAGTQLVKAGEVPDALSIVLTGQVRVVHDREAGGSLLDVLGRGAHFGETAIDAAPAPFSVYTQTECDILALPSAELVRLAAEWPDIEAALHDHLTRRLRIDLAEDKGRHEAAHVTPDESHEDTSSADAAGPPVDGDGRIAWQRRAFQGPGWRARRRTPVVREVSPSDSGPACLASVCHFYGRWVSLNGLREACDAIRSDAHLAGLRAAAESRGFETRAGRASWRELTVNQLPAIVRVTGHRWLAVYAATDARVVVVDPAAGRRVLEPQEFTAHWTGDALFLRPTPAFADAADAKPTFARFLPYLRPLRRVLAELVLASVIIQVLSLALPVFARFAVDEVIARRDDRWLLPAVEAMAAVLALWFATSVSRRYLTQFVSQRVDADLGADFYQHLLGLPLRFFERRTVGDVVSRFEEAGKLTEFLTGTGAAFFIDMATAALAVALMAYFSVPLTLLALGCVAVEVAHLFVITPYLKGSLRRLAQNSRESDGLLIESLAGLRTIKILAVEHYTRWSLEHRLVRQINTSLGGLRHATIATSASHLLSACSAIAVLFYGAVLVLRGQLTVGELVAVGLLTRSVTAPFATLASVWSRLQDARHSVEQLNDVLETPTETPLESAPDQVVLHRLNGHVRFENVSFRYEEGAPDVLRGVNFECYAGQRLAIVGPSGSGKSTVIKLLLGFYRPSSGRVSIDGFDLADVWLPSLRGQLGVVLQEPQLFHSTIRANISLALPAASLHEVATAARLVNAHTWISRLPLGYETVLDENGSNLSGGQRQQVAIARALLPNRRLVIFDEATSNLDSESERLCHQNVDLQFKDSTIITITQRLHTVRHADVIIVMDRGVVIEAGDHSQLMDRQGLYSRLYAQQNP